MAASGVAAVSAVLVLVGSWLVLALCSWSCRGARAAAAATRLAGTSFMPHCGQRSGLSLVTSGCMGHT